MSDEAVKKQVDGVCTEISEKNGWTAFAIDVGSQYPIRLSTKLPALIEQGRAAGQQRAVWTYKESQGKENPNKPGTFFVNRYLDSVEVGGTVEPSAAAAQTTAPNRARTTDRSIERQVILKEMVSHYPGLDKLSVDGWWALMAGLDAFMQDGVPAAIPAPEDDIPFE